MAVGITILFIKNKCINAVDPYTRGTFFLCLAAGYAVKGVIMVESQNPSSLFECAIIGTWTLYIFLIMSFINLIFITCIHAALYGVGFADQRLSYQSEKGIPWIFQV